MSENQLEKFTSWVDQILIDHAGESPVAYNFNLYEHPESFAIQLIGATKYDANDQDWACHESFSSGKDLFEIPHALVGDDWKQGLEAAKSLISDYLERGVYAARLKAARAVCVGFVDGDLEVVHSREEI